jgi:ATP-dependent helicase/nuclease subunit A
MPSDAQLTKTQRAAAIESVQENVALRSGAGCGKTFVLARRFLELLQRAASPAANADEGDEALSKFVALTFTNKAALEMSTRVRAMIDERARQVQGPDRARLLAWLDQMPEARISTIDGFCAALLRSHAVEARIDPSFTVCADDLLVSRMVADAAEQAVLAAVEDQRRDLGELLVDMSFDAIVTFVQDLMENRLACDLKALRDGEAVYRRWQEIIDTNRPKWLAPLADDVRIREEVDALAAIDCNDPADKLAAYRDEQLDAIGKILANPPAATAEMFARLSAKPGNIGSAKAWGAKEVLMDVRGRMRDLVATVANYAEFCEDLGPDDVQAAAGLATLASLALDADKLYAARKRSRGLLDFTDLLDYANRLLSGNAELQKTLGDGIEQLLIDECQDTNRFQLETLSMLIGGGTPEQAPPDGKLFAVGDAKQSIYRFRGAQVEVFSQMCERLGKARQKHLDTSFRTHEAGVAFINELFAPLMGDAFAPTDAHRKVCPPQPSVEFILAAGRGAPGADDEQPIDCAADAAEAQAAACAQRIDEIIHGDECLVWDSAAEAWRRARPGDIAILFARMTNSLMYERALQQRGIPYYVVAGTGFFQRQEVFDVLTALGAVDNPRDDIALLGTLRGGLFGLSDNALMHVAQACEPPYWPSLRELCAQPGATRELADRLEPAEAEALAAAVDLIGRLHRIKDALPIDILLQRLLDAAGYEATLLSQFQGRRMLSNVRQVAQRAATASADHLALADFLTEMRRQVADQSRYEQAAVAGEREDVVRLMTIHKAKGLEFPVVVIPDLNAGRRGHGGKLLIRDDWGPTFNRPASPDDDDQAKPLSFRLAGRLEDADDRAEDFRRLYVAATRHEDHLIFIGADWRKDDGSFIAADSYLAQIDGVLDLSGAIEQWHGHPRQASGPQGGSQGPAHEPDCRSFSEGRSHPPKADPARTETPDLQGQDGPATHGRDGHATRNAAEPDARGEIAYGDGRFRAVVRRLTPAAAPDQRRPSSAGRKILDAASGAADLAERIIRAARGPADLPLVGPLPATVGQVGIAVTALNDFESCPMLYRWRHELRLPRSYESLIRGSGQSGHRERLAAPASGFSALDAATIGTLYHKCMELLDVEHPQDAGLLIAQAAQMLDIEASPALDGLATEFSAILSAFTRHNLAVELRSARQMRRELDFVLDCPPATIRGQIDLIYQDPAGAWHIVDYKSDNVEAGLRLTEHARRYELQLLLYAHAAGRHLGGRVADATLYFLRTGSTCAIPVDAAALGAATHRAAGLARDLITSRRGGVFQRRAHEHCTWCPYAGLCEE